MPDRYVSDTSSKCMTLTQSRWVTTWVDSCYSISDLIGGQNNTGGAIARDTLGNYLLIEATRVGSSVSFAMMVEPGVEQEMAFDISYVNSGTGSLLAIEESIGGQWKTLNSVPLDTRGNIRLPFVSLLGNVRVSVTGPTQTLLNRICRKKPVQYQESYLTQVCNGDKDRYRFGFNGQEKDNEMKGVGNSLDFGARMYDSRVARWAATDPVEKRYPDLTTYGFAADNPIIYIDPDGEKVVNADKVRKEIAGNKIKLCNERLVELTVKYESIDKRKLFTGTSIEWKNIERIKGLLKEAQKAYEEYKYNEVKSEKIINDWKERSPNLFNKIDNMVNAANEPVDMMLGVKDLFNKNDNKGIGGYNELPKFIKDDDGIVKPKSREFGLNKITVFIEIDDVDRAAFSEWKEENIENHEAGHFEYMSKNSEEYDNYLGGLGKRSLNGGHNSDDESGKKATEYGKKNDIEAK
jgi:RHS repeat-associated protein